MAEPELVRETVTPRRAIPDVVDVDISAGLPPHSARETSLLRDLTGRGFSELAGEDADEGDRERVIVWFTLRRLGYEPTWEEAGDVLIRYVTPGPPNGEQPAGSPPSATSGA